MMSMWFSFVFAILIVYALQTNLFRLDIYHLGEFGEKNVDGIWSVLNILFGERFLETGVLCVLGVKIALIVFFKHHTQYSLLRHNFFL